VRSGAEKEDVSGVERNGLIFIYWWYARRNKDADRNILIVSR
jgi:hypothetical protein